MKLAARLACLLLLFAAALRADTPKSVTSTQCFQDAQGNCLANGYMTLTLSTPAVVASGGGQVVPRVVTVTLDSTGNVAAGQVMWANDQLNPKGTGYAVVIYNSAGTVVSRPGTWVIQGNAPIDLAQEQPTTTTIAYPAVVSGTQPIVIGDCSTWASLYTLASFPCLGGAINFDLQSPQTTDSGTFQWEPKNQLKLSRLSCSCDVGTVSINLDIRTESAPNTTGTLVLSSPLVCTPTTGVTTTFAVPIVPGSSPVALIIAATSGNPGVVRVNAQY